MSKAVIDDRALLSPVCTLCKHLDSASDMTCKAFPKGIPQRIWKGKIKHKRAISGDNGIHFELTG